ncbi:hypothetical protein MPTK1_3g04270 [Marchantia polymorpha subsp. ruderalis]|uniref:non-specific serine/threonine protein kinase n=2 Tax=Marchantia polymorpha TaxID=3197 RepID=A0AAF6AXB7_MARPO|nr:hypothetical protein MARPO_0022s0104 [Marchantia polymorpha]BBN04401.1 hypothetical protein Mp_3g04270 [Marchantia polymorpha subsp. ruderalis]|eukprot:PTQ44003.1 hypothetical protein MARPO_0022s0104 [Marchantia polymorpha]
MWRLKQFIPKEQAGLEGKTVDVGALKLQVRSTIAQGGFSCVYLARDASSGRQYALKHIICNDAESVDLVKNEVAVMKVLRGHPNVVTLHAQVVYDMGRTKECFLVMDYCEKMLANVLEQRGAGYFEEKQLLLIFRDICNAVYGMHSQSPPIAHRDLKVENVLMGGDGTWKLCDFGSTSTNHKRFEKADEMGLEEDNIRKYTTPAYRAPEMWDLFRRELINEKVDIWALGCLLYRIAYLKSAFDGESKLQILNGNYRIPEAPRYSSTVVDLIRSMLTADPGGRPDVMQVWRRVNEALPADVKKPHPDKPPSAPASREQAEIRPDLRTNTQSKAPAPARSPPLPPSQKDSDRRSAQNGSGGIAAGAFWSTQYAQEAVKQESDASLEKPVGTDNPAKLRSSSPGSRSRREESTPAERTSITGQFLKKSTVTNLIKKVQGSVQSAGGWGRDDPEHNGYEMRLESDDQKADEEVVKGYSHLSSSQAVGVPDKSAPSNDAAFNEFAAHFESSANLTPDAGMRRNSDTSNRSQSDAAGRSHHDMGSRNYADTGNQNPQDSGNRNQQYQADLERLNKELQQALAEKAVVSSQYEKLTAICRSQRQEIQELKSALASTSTPSHPMSARTRTSPAASHSVHSQPQQQAPGGWQAFDQPRERQSGSIWDLQEGLSPGGSKSQRMNHAMPLSPDSTNWQAFSDSPSRLGVPSPLSEGRRRTVQQHARAASMGGGDWGFSPSQDSPSNNGGSQSQSPTGMFGNVSTYTGSSAGNTVSVGDSRSSRPAVRHQPSGWAGF